MRRERTWRGSIVLVLAATATLRAAGAAPVDWSELLDEGDPLPSATERAATPTEPVPTPTRVEPSRSTVPPRPRAQRRPEKRQRTRQPESEFPLITE